MAGNAKVLQQHVAGEDVGRRQLFDRQPVVLQRFAHLGGVGVLQIQVQRGHPALGPAVADQHRIALHLHRGGGNLQ
ncbi:hypothetical protein D3C80_1786600 [compost metagenome]